MKKAQMIQKMIDFYEGSVHDVEHFLKVLSYAGMIGKLEGLDEKTQDILEMAAIVHDIACPLCREKYGNTDGKHQEAESEALLRPFLFEFNLAEEVLERVIYLVSHHHTFSGIDGQDYQILVEADFLVNASEAQMSRAQIEAFKGKVAKTETGKGLLDSIYLR
ncbi:HD domain-containing protein [Anaerovoracaceae bacterium 41-7]|jgi:HD superfamily phosphodiesterase|uniref:HD domain-containing protein n=1 Tax=Anaerotruncus colihominis TaxID=169435 RepID=A0A845QKA1_9FIRM|nr:MULTISPECIES: HD domain-containing protein [Eubacteriales]NBH60528.1 HD domain-containing protein [Anaerotruncus colihominis]NCF01182.1 HD domain-containing protein [Anaerotruncus sp. 80]